MFREINIFDKDGTDQIGVDIMTQICNREEVVSSLGRGIIKTVSRCPFRIHIFLITVY